MTFLWEDLPKHGLVLVPPESGDYDRLLSDIQRRLAESVDGSPTLPERMRAIIFPEDRPTSAILLNGSAKAIAAMQVVWRFETETGRSYHHYVGMLSAQSLLLRFGRPDDANLKLYGYWHTILPGSKRYLTKSGMVGDNSDVRPPAEDEKWRGGIIYGGSQGGRNSSEPVRRVTLVLDGVFFLDGEFVGPNSQKLFEQTVADAEAHLMVARIAREGHDRGRDPGEILADIERTTGPAPERPMMNFGYHNPGASSEDFRLAALQRVAYQLARPLRFANTPDREEKTVLMVMDWNDTTLPHFRRGD